MMEVASPVPRDIAASWDGLAAELDAWHAAGRTATLWWRDDDATEPSPALDRLLAVASGLPLTIAAVPAQTRPELVDRLVREKSVTAVQHGYAHVNHAPPDGRKSELGPERPLGRILEELERGRARLAALFGERFAPVLAPPWNRIGEAVAAALPQTGIRALSGFGSRRAAAAMPQVNTHLDIIDWRGGRGFVGTAAALAALAGHLGQRRAGAGAETTPSGLLTHHRDNDAAAWRFLEDLLDRTAAHPAARWIGLPAGLPASS